MGEEQRRARRYAAELEVRYERASDFVREYTENVSHGGIFVRTEQPLRTGDLVKMHIMLPGEEQPLVIEGSVTHSRPQPNGLPAGMGVEFIAYNPNDADRLQAFIARIAETE